MAEYFTRSTSRGSGPACPSQHGARIVADLSFPVILGPDGRVMDGMHRIARAILQGRTEVSAVRFPALPDPDYRDCQPADLPY